MTRETIVLMSNQFCEHQNYHIAHAMNITYVILCTAGTAHYASTLTFVLEDHATVRIELINAIADINITIVCVLRGNASNVIICGANIVGNTQQVRIHTMQHHKAAYTTSSCLIKNSVSDEASVVYTGMIRVEKEASSSVSSLENKNILIGDKARALAVPSLEVLTDAVKCSHGSATGRYDQEAVLYGATRGINEESMQKLLKKAFFADMFITEQAITFLHKLL